MFTKSHLLALDEPTDSLDDETEASISADIHVIQESTTVVMFADRLPTVRNTDILDYLAGGKVVATGAFEEVRRALPDLDLQARLMRV